MLPTWTVPNNYNIGSFSERITVSYSLPVSGDASLTTTVISGELPAGLRVENNAIVGTPYEVARSKSSLFVIRARTTAGVLDRTFNITIEGPDNPNWVTPAGRLPVGPNGVYFILDSSIIDFQLLATDPDLPAGDTLSYYIASGDGELPPGIRLTTDGRLTGVVDPILALDVTDREAGYDETPFGRNPFDFSTNSDSGIDSFYYDMTVYDYAVPTRGPVKLNRMYEFYVTVTDNVSSTKRRFQIYVVGDDFPRSDNTIMKAGDGIYTADITYLRTPLWLTPADLGVRRANNYQTVYLNVLDPNSIQGELKYFLETINDDNTPSVLPPGLTLDEDTGELAGIIPYQPAVTKEYKFTINALRYDPDIGLVTVFANSFEDTLSGSTSLKINKLSENVIDGLSELDSLVGKTLAIEERNYLVESVDNANEDYDILYFTSALQPYNKATPINVSRFAPAGRDYFFATSLSLNDAGFYTNRKLNYSSTESYTIQDVYPYIEWDISIDDSTSGSIELNYSVVTESGSTDIEYNLAYFLEADGRDAYITATRNESDKIISLRLLIPATAQNRNKNFIKSLFHTSDSAAIYANELVQEDRIKLDIVLQRNLSTNRQISISVRNATGFNKTFSVNETEVVSKAKTFTIRLLGEVDSTITWLTSADLGTLNANRISTLSVEAETSVPNAVLKYSLVSGSLPFGLSLKDDGEIIGKVAIYGTATVPGLTFFDNGETTFDAAKTTLDRSYSFTILARDRFGFSATTRTFTLFINDADNLTYSNIYFKPFLKTEQKQSFLNLINNANVIDTAVVYRANDRNFGVQKELRALVWGGIETLSVSSYISAISKNHKKKRFMLGDVKTAVAKTPGTNNVIYEVVYVDLIDAGKPSSSKTNLSFNTVNNKRITVDSIRYEPTTDYVELNSQYKPSYRNRPLYPNTTTVDSDAIKASQSTESKRYISNIDTMRDRIKEAGTISKDFLPLWMRTGQNGSLTELGYVLAIPLVYTKPGYSEIIAANILNNGFDFKTLDYEIDRYIIDSTAGNSTEQYLLFANYQFNV
jgi:hypothetical protein